MLTTPNAHAIWTYGVSDAFRPNDLSLQTTTEALQLYDTPPRQAIGRLKRKLDINNKPMSTLDVLVDLQLKRPVLIVFINNSDHLAEEWLYIRDIGDVFKVVGGVSNWTRIRR